MSADDEPAREAGSRQGAVPPPSGERLRIEAAEGPASPLVRDSSGCSVQHRSIPWGQRGAKRHPGGISWGGGTSPGIGSSLWRLTLTCGRARSRPWVYGWRGSSNSSSTGRLLDNLPRVHHRHPVGDRRHHGQVVGDQQHRHVALALLLDQLIEYLRLDGHVERRGRLVGDEDVRDPGPGQGRS